MEPSKVHGRFDIVSYRTIDDRIAIVFRKKCGHGGTVYVVYVERDAFKDAYPYDRLRSIVVCQDTEELRSTGLEDCRSQPDSGQILTLGSFDHTFLMCPPEPETDTRQFMEILENREYAIVLAYRDDRDLFLILKTTKGDVRRRIETHGTDDRLWPDIVRRPEHYRYYHNMTSGDMFKSGVSAVKESTETGC
ncbi:MAG TPA: hypothetical protein VN420_02815 [Candidatus Fimivivens sp.]|nr:hypothetical protein [Candidatus Fimivivens sp.]